MKHKLSDRHHLQNLTRQIILACWVIIICIGFVFGQSADERKLELVVESAHTTQVSSIAVSPDGKYLASAGGSIIIWDAVRKNIVKQIAKNEFSESIEFSPNGEMLVSCNNTNIMVWELKTGKQLKKWETGCWGVNPISFSPDGKLIAVTNGSWITIWDINKGIIKELNGPATSLSVSFSPDGKVLACVGEDKISPIKIWKVETWTVLHSLTGHREFLETSYFRVWGIEFSPDGNFIATSSADNSIIVWDWQKNTILQTLRPHIDLDRAFAFSPDGQMIATSGDNQIKLWELSTGNLKKEFDEPQSGIYFNPILVCRFSNNGKTLISGSGERISFWDIASEKQTHVLQSKNISSLTSTDDGSTLVVAFDSSIVILDLIKLQFNVLPIRFEGYTKEVVFSSDGRYLAAVNERSGVSLEDNEIKVIIWDFKTKKELRAISEKEPIPKWVKLNETKKFAKIVGKLIEFKTDGASIIFLNSSDKREIFRLILQNEKDWAIITPDGRFDASEGALKLMHYAYGLEVINLDQLKEAYYEPGLLQKLLGYNKEDLRPIVPHKDVKLYPEIVEQKFDEQSGILTVKLKNRGGGIGETRVLVNDSLVVPDARDDKLKANPNVPPDAVVTLTVDLPKANWLKGKENKITVVTSNHLKEIGKGNIQSRGAEIVYLDKGKEEATLPNLYAIVGGVSDYEGDQIDLRFAAKDAEDFSNALSLGARKLFCDKANPNCLDKVNIKTLSTNRQSPDEQPTKENFRKAFAEIAEKAKPEDIVVVYLAGHGVTLGTGTDTYFYLTKEARAASKSSLQTNFQTVAISNEELTDWLTPNPSNADDIWIKAQKRVLILDTCAAGNFAEKDKWRTDRDLSGDQIRAIDFLKGKTGTFILMGSSANQPSYESNKYGQGLLTFALLEGMKGQALQKPTDNIDVRLLFDYAEKRVPELGKDINLDQRPIIKQPSGNTFVIGQMSDSEKQKISLPQPKPLMLRPSLGVLPINNDPLQLIPKLRKIFDAESSYEVIRQRGGKEPNLVYIDNDNFPGGIRITGTYTVEGENVKVKAYLVKDEKVIAELPEIVSGKDKILDELLKVLQDKLLKI